MMDRRSAIAAIILAAATIAVRASGSATLDETAKFLAGITLPSNSSLATVAAEPVLRENSASFAAAWTGLERVEIPKIRAWSARHLSGRPKVIRYMFSGPDFIYADALFPHAQTYIFSGIEPVGRIPDIGALPKEIRAHALACVRAPFDYFQNYGVFVTAELHAANESCEFKGNLPLLLLALSRAGKTIRTVEFVEIGEGGETLPRDSDSNEQSASGVKIEFEDRNRRQRSLYYFNVDLSDAAAGVTRFLKFCEGFGDAATFLKGASYLLHRAEFSKTRSFILDHSKLIVQDDSGIPLKYFKDDAWSIRPFGSYRKPIRIFTRFDQPDMHTLFDKRSSPPIDFGFGYRWRSDEANLLLLTRHPLKKSNN